MAVAVVYPLVAAVIFLILILSPSPKHDKDYLQLNRRLRDKHAPFDPLVRQWKSQNEQGLEKQNEEVETSWKNQIYELSLNPPPGWDFGLFEDPEEYFGEEGRLNVTASFLHPEDSNKEKVQLWLLKEKTSEMDNDKDGKLNFVEFRDHAYDVYKKYFEFENGETHVPNAEEKFADLDTNGDRFLTEEELRPLIQYLHPGEITYAKYYTKNLFNQADEDGDGKLTLHEMLDNAHIFYSAVIKDSDYDDDDDDDNEDDDEDDFHDEFR